MPNVRESDDEEGTLDELGRALDVDETMLETDGDEEGLEEL